MTKSNKIIMALLVAWILVHTLIVVLVGISDNPKQADCILILGNKVNQDGTLSARLESRVKKGLELYQKKQAPFIVVSGGLRKEGFIEAVAMANYLKQNNVPDSAIILEDKATTTLETMQNYIPIAHEKNFKSTILVSQFYHLLRAESMLTSFNHPTIYRAHSNYFEAMDFIALGKEFIGFYSFKLLQFYQSVFKK